MKISDENNAMDTNCPSRLAIYQCYDKDGVIDDYIVYFLQDLMENVTDLVVTVNGILSPEGRQRIRQFTEEIFVRDDLGFDAGAWRDTMIDYLGWDEVSKYDELILINDSFFGPFYPLREVFGTMEKRPVDFWGISAHSRINQPPDASCPYPYVPEHIQCYFIVFHKNLHTSYEFKNYWNHMPYFSTPLEATCGNEIVLTKYFADRGYSWDVLSDTRDLDGEADCPQSVAAHCFFNVYEMIVHRECPVLKRHCFGFSYQNHLLYTDGLQLRRTVDYIASKTSYDVSMIYKNITRIYNVADIFFNLHLSFILSKKYHQRRNEKSHKAVFVFHISYMDLLDELYPFISQIPVYVDVIMTTKPEANISIIEKLFRPALGERLRVLLAPAKGRDLSALLVAAAPYLKGYDYVGYCHDKHHQPSQASMVGTSFRTLIWENTIGSGAYVDNVLDLLETKPEIGILCPPPPHFSVYAGLINYWCNGENYSLAQDLASRLKLHANFSIECTPLTLGTSFWCRREALQPLLEYPWREEDFPSEPMPLDSTLNHALERIFSFVAQSQGFLTGWMMTEEYATLEVNNLFYQRYCIAEALQQEVSKPLVIPPEEIERIEKQGVSRFVKKLLPKPLWGIAKAVKNRMHW